MDDEDLISAKRRKVNSENIQHLLFDRERGLRHKVSNRRLHQDFYKCITPNLSVLSVDAPTIFLRRFTQDGRYLLAFSQDQTSLLVYEFMGTAKAAELVSPNKYDVCLRQKRNTRLPNTLIDNKIHKSIFNTLFKQRQNIYVNLLSKQLSRECSLFTFDGEHVILGGSSIIPEDRRPSFYDIYLTNDTIADLNPEDYVIWMVNFKKGEVTDSITFNADKIHLSNNHGIYLYKNSFGVISILHQTIYTYEILNGKFIPVNVIGQFCNADDRTLYNQTYPASVHRPSKEITLNSMKQRILSFLYRHAQNTKDFKERAFNVRKFYQWFDLYESIRMYKIQFVDENNLMIKYTIEDVVTHKVLDPIVMPTFLVFYNISASKVFAIYEHKSKNLLTIYEHYCDYFRNLNQPIYNLFGAVPCSSSNNLYANLLVQNWKRTVKGQNGQPNLVEIAKRILAQLPVSAQSYSYSTYLDLGVFSYDDKSISVLERPKNCSENPIAFFSRDSGRLLFRITPSVQESPRGIVAYIIHPYEPFIISVHRTRSQDYTINFHLRNQNSIYKYSAKNTSEI